MINLNNKEIKVVDFHTHIFPDRLASLAISNLENAANSNAFFDGTVDGLQKNMEQNGIDYSLCLPIITNPRHTQKINDYAIFINNNQDQYANIYSFGGLHPLDEHYEEEIDRLIEHHIKGIKLHPVYQQMPVDDSRFIRLINTITSKGLYVLIHAGLDPGFPGNDFSSVERMNRMIEQVKTSEKIILAHLGGLFTWNEVLHNYDHFKGYFDLAMTFGKIIRRDQTTLDLIDEELFQKILEKFGSERILMGSDNPWTPSDECVDYICKLKIKEEEKENILYKNAYKILDLE